MLQLISTTLDDPSDQDFMVELYTRYKRLMYATVRKYFSEPEICKDLVQESVLKLIPKISFLREQVPYIYASYITAVVRNTAISCLRKQKREARYCASLEDLDPAPEVMELTLDELMALRERKDCLREVWSKLTEEDRFLLEGKYILSYSDAELAEGLGCKASSIRMKLTRARRRAAEEMLRKVGDRNEQA